MAKQEIMAPPTRMYPEEIWDEILDKLCEGMTLREVCRSDPHRYPAEKNVRKRALWDAEWGSHYVRARQVGYLRMADEIIEIADTPCPMVVEIYDKDGNLREKKIADNTQHRMNQINTRKWMLAKMLPKVFGDNATVTHQHQVERIEKATLELVRPKPREDDE